MATHCSTLYPGETSGLPATLGPTVAARILLTLKSFENVVATRVSHLRGGSGSLMGASSATANEHHQRFLIYLAGKIVGKIGVVPHTGI